MAHDGIEVEIKLRIDEETYERVKFELDACAVFLGLHEHVDRYYSPHDGEYMKHKYPYQWLSLRTRNCKHSLNYKHFHPAGAKRHAYCEEYNVGIDDLHQMQTLLVVLGFEHLVTVAKKREIYHLCGSFEVALDRVSDLGYFLEIEAIADFGGPIQTRRKLLEVAESLRLDTSSINHRGYPYEVLNSRG
jgi:predicted adenylyl cyclase CyaB